MEEGKLVLGEGVSYLPRTKLRHFLSQLEGEGGQLAFGLPPPSTSLARQSTKLNQLASLHSRFSL